MHFTTTIASTAALLLAATTFTAKTTLVSAQTVPLDCGNCVLAAALAESPTCDATTLGTTHEPSAMTPKEKACFCPLASSDAWIQVCVKPGACSAADVGALVPQFVMNKDAVCADISNPSGTTSGVLSATGGPSVTGTPSSTTAGGMTSGSGVKPTTTAPAPAPPKNGAGSLFGGSNGIMGGVIIAVTVVSAALLS